MAIPGLMMSGDKNPLPGTKKVPNKAKKNKTKKKKHLKIRTLELNDKAAVVFKIKIKSRTSEL